MCEAIRSSSDAWLDGSRVVIISNPSKQVPLWEQNAGTHGFVVWDYHVVLLQKEHSGNLVYDLDSRLPFPCAVSEYLSNTLKPHLQLQDHFKRFFKLITARDYLQTFASDRSHMKSRDGLWLKPPPDYPPITFDGCTHNLDKFTNMNDLSGPVCVYEQHHFITFCQQF